MREIEIKARILDVEKVKKALMNNGIIFGEEKQQHDLVFCKPGQEEYQIGSQWLRIRTENEHKVIFTLKIDTGRKLDSIEHEMEVNDAKELETMLRLMGYELFSDISKTRQKAKKDKIEVCLDQIEGLGTYLEAEILAEDDVHAQDILDELWTFFESVGIAREDAEMFGYDVLHRRKYGAPKISST